MSRVEEISRAEFEVLRKQNEVILKQQREIIAVISELKKSTSTPHAKKTVHCSICGMAGVNRKTHNQHSKPGYVQGTSSNRPAESSSSTSSHVGQMKVSGKWKDVFRGPKGGLFCITDSGKKSYVKDDEVEFN